MEERTLEGAVEERALFKIKKIIIQICETCIKVLRILYLFSYAHITTVF